MTHRFHIRIIERNQKNWRCILIQRDVKSADELIKLLESISEFNPHTLLAINAVHV
jgi:hypothetical protein